MYEISFTATGVVAWALEEAGVRAARIKAIARATLKQAESEFATRSGRESLDFRFTDQAGSSLNLGQRSSRYQAAQRRILGRVRPFFSPKRKVAHMQNIVRIEGPGHRVSLVNGGSSFEVRARLTVTGARILNFTRRVKEFVNLTRGGPGYDPTSAKWLQNRWVELAHAALWAEIANRVGPKQLKG